MISAPEGLTGGQYRSLGYSQKNLKSLMDALQEDCIDISNLANLYKASLFSRIPDHVGKKR